MNQSMNTFDHQTDIKYGNDDNTLQNNNNNKAKIDIANDQDDNTITTDLYSVEDCDINNEDICTQSEQETLDNNNLETNKGFIERETNVHFNKNKGYLNENKLVNNDISNEINNDCRCKACKFQQLTKNKLSRNKKFFCYIHEKKFTNKLIFKEHLKKKHYLLCNYCQNEIFLDKGKISEFVERLYSFKCSECQNKYHCTQEALNYNPQICNSYKCNDCNQRFNNEYALNKHISQVHSEKVDKSYNESVPATVQKVNESNQNDLQESIFDSKQKKNNQINQEEIETETEIEKDIKIVKSITPIQEDKIITNEPTNELRTEINSGEFNKGEDIKPKINNSDNVYKDDHDNNVFQCEKCNKLFKTEIAKIDHFKGHENECSECKKLFEFQIDYLKHCNEHHFHVCSECSRKFKTIEGLATHYKTVHGSIGKYKCNEHDVSFVSVDELTKHFEENHLKQKGKKKKKRKRSNKSK